MEMSMLETQKLVLRWQEEQLLQMQLQQQPRNQSSFNEMNILSFMSDQEQNFQALNMGCHSSPITEDPSLSGLQAQPIKADPGVENQWIDYEMQKSGITDESNTGAYGVNYAISRTASCPPLVVEQKLSGAAGKESFKRKAESNLAKKVEEESRSKKSKECAEEEESKITEQNSNINNSNNNKRSQKTSNSNDNTKAFEGQKPDYIHVRARRGQATDSHSLAERVRREKISERMKYLQNIVPGCNKITGKAGMLDEIINYVQSLQRQVEFLSMKLAAVNPRIDFNINDLFAKEVLAACSTSMPTKGVYPDMEPPNYLQYHPMQQIDPTCGPGFAMNQIDMELQRAISAPVSIPENAMDPSCFNFTNSLPWEGDLQHMYAMEFQQGRSTLFPLQTFTGTIEPSNLKMEM